MADLVLVPVINPDFNKLDEAYEVEDDYEVTVKNVRVCVPPYFQFDGASIPAAGWQIIGTPFNPKFMRAAVVHDWLYHTHQVEIDAANDIFFRLLKRAEVNNVKATLMLEAVRVAGGWYWENDADDLKYLRKLVSKLKDEGRDLSKYHFSDS